MHADFIRRKFRILTFIIPALAMAACGQGDGPESIENTPATPLPPIPPGFCDNINFEVLCPPAMIVNFNGGATTVIDNPDMSGINTSDMVAQMQKFPDEVFGGTKFDLPEAVDFAEGESYTVAVWSPRAVEVSFKLEETGNPAGGVTLVANHSGSSMWEELCFDFTGRTASIPTDVLALTIIFDNGTQGAADTDPANWTFFYDDITQVADCGGGGPPPSFPITFDEATPPAVTPFGGAVTAIEPGPAGGDGNALRITRDGGDVFAGAFVSIPAIPNDQGVQTVSALVYSPIAGIPMIAKAEFGDNMGTGDVPANEAVVVGWQTLTWTFSNLAAPNVYNRFTILPNLGTVDTATDYFFDNIDLVGAGGGSEPATAAPTPAQNQADVISLFSDAYADVAVDSFLAGFSSAAIEDFVVTGDTSKKYTVLDFAGIEFLGGNAVDASGMTHIHMDIWTPDATSFSFKLVDFGGDGFGGGNDSENALITFDAGSTPALAQGAWISIDVALADLQAAGLTNLTDLNQLIIVAQPSGASTIFLDNLYFYNDAGGGGATEPAAAAPTPTQNQADVISLFSDAYTDVAVDTFLAGFSSAAIEDFVVAGDTSKKYTVLDFAGIEFLGANAIDASGMTHIHMDVWTPDATSFSFKLVDFGGDGFGGGNDSENALVTFDAGSTPALAQGSWVSIDVALADLQAAGLTNLTDLNQLIIVAQPSGAATVFVDNLYFYNDSPGAGNEPAAAAPTPTQDPADVISLFSDAYTDVPVDTFLAGFSAAAIEDFVVAGDTSKKYTVLDFAGIEFLGANAIDASGMTHIHMDIWTPDATSFSFKFVDFGGDGFGGGNDSENALITIDAGSTPPLTQGNWISIDIALTDLLSAGLASLADLNQLIIVGQPSGASTIFLDNLYFYNDAGGGGGNAPTVAAPTPTQDPANVISLFSNTYGDVAVDTFLTPWSAAMLEDVVIDGSDMKKYTVLDFAGIEFVGANAIDATGMTHVHMDVWTPDATSFSFKFVDFGGDGFGGGNDTENVPIVFDAASTPALTQGAWVSIDVSIADLQAAGLASVADLNQLIIIGQPTGAATVFVDNLYFYDDSGGGGGGAPTVGAAAPTQDPAVVMSLYSDAYTDAAVTWPTPWSVPNDTTSDVMIDGGLVKEHLNVTFIGVEFPTMDVSGATHLHIDVWTPDATSLLIKLVDFGGDGFGGGNDTEGSVTFDAGTTPALTQGTWVALDIPLADFLAAGLGSLNDINQLVMDPTPDGTTLYIDNVYFYDDGSGGGGNAPTSGAAAPTQDPASVISLFSDAYVDVPVDTFLTPWSSAMLEDTTAGSDPVKKYSVLDFAGIEFVGANAIDATGMTHVHMDVWTPDATSFSFKFVDFGGDGFGGGNDTENVPIVFDAGSTPALAQGAWVGIDVSIADLQAAGLASVADLNQLIIIGQPAGAATVFLDNLYFYNDASGATVLASFDEAMPPAVTPFGGAATSIEPGPAGGDGNALRITRDGGDVFAGAWVAVAPIPNDQGTQTVSALVYSPTAGIPIVAKAEYGDNMGTGDVQANEAVVVGWQTLSWTFTNLAAPNVYNRFTILPNLGTVDTATDYFFDNITLEAGGGGGGGGGGGSGNCGVGEEFTLNGDFETGDFTGWEEFPNGGTISIVAGNASTSAGRLDASGMPVGVTLKQANLCAGSLTPGQQVTVSFDWQGSDAIGGVVDVRLLSELTGGGVSQEDIILGGAGFPAGWTTVGPLNITVGPDVSGGVTLQFTAICGGDAGCVSTIDIDNVSVSAP